MNENMNQYLEKAKVLIEALPYIQRFNRKIVVVKYGGSAMTDEALKQKVIEDVTLLKLVGFKPIIVHGGGKEISKWVGKIGKEPQFINGLRVTDEETMEVAEMVLGKVNKSLVQLLEGQGAIARAMKAEKLAFLTDIEGVYKDPKDPATLISELLVKEAKQLIEEGYIGGGMLPKLNNCIDAIENGVSRVHILDGRIPHCLLLEFFTNKGIGTAILHEEESRYYDGE